MCRAALCSITRGWLALDGEGANLETRTADPDVDAAPAQTGTYDIGHLTAATILTAAGDSPDRIRSEAT